MGSEDSVRAGTASTLWTDLVAGRATIVEHGVDEHETWLRLRPSPPGEKRPFTDQQVLVAQWVLQGYPQKLIGLELGISPSLVSGSCSEVLRGFGAGGSARHAPMALVMVAAAQHASGAQSLPGYRLITKDQEPPQLEVRMRRPEIAFRELLTQSEYETLAALLAGHSYRDVGALRGRSPRTVANQIRSATTKLNAYGRLQLIRAAVALNCDGHGWRSALLPTPALREAPVGILQSSSFVHLVRTPLTTSPFRAARSLPAPT